MAEAHQQVHKTPAASQAAAPQGTDSAPHKPGFVSQLTGWHIIRRQASFVRKRSSMPLLRKVVKDQMVLNKTIVGYEVIPEEILEKTLKGHIFLLAFMAVVFLWGLLTVVKGLAAGFHFGLWFNNWIIGGAPILVLASARIYTSHRVINGVRTALKQRTRTAASVQPRLQ